MKKYNRDIWRNAAMRRKMRKTAERLVEDVDMKFQPIIVQKVPIDVQKYGVRRAFRIDEAAVLGDEGIHDVLAADFLSAIKEMMDVEYVDVDMFNATYIYKASVMLGKPV